MQLGEHRWRDLLAAHDTAVRRELGAFGGKEISWTGDGFVAAFAGPSRALECACSVRDALRRLGIEVRAGLHTGECELLAGDQLGGVAVHIGARVAALAGAGEVLLSSMVKDLVAGSGIEFVERGSHLLKGVPGEWVSSPSRRDGRRRAFVAAITASEQLSACEVVPGDGLG